MEHMQVVDCLSLFALHGMGGAPARAVQGRLYKVLHTMRERLKAVNTKPEAEVEKLRREIMLGVLEQIEGVGSSSVSVPDHWCSSRVDVSVSLFTNRNKKSGV